VAGERRRHSECVPATNLAWDARLQVEVGRGERPTSGSEITSAALAAALQQNAGPEFRWLTAEEVETVATEVYAGEEGVRRNAAFTKVGAEYFVPANDWHTKSSKPRVILGSMWRRVGREEPQRVHGGWDVSDEITNATLAAALQRGAGPGFRWLTADEVGNVIQEAEGLKADSFVKVGVEYFAVATDKGARWRLAEALRGRGIEASFDNNTDYFTSLKGTPTTSKVLKVLGEKGLAPDRVRFEVVTDPKTSQHLMVLKVAKEAKEAASNWNGVSIHGGHGSSSSSWSDSVFNPWEPSVGTPSPPIESYYGF